MDQEQMGAIQAPGKPTEAYAGGMMARSGRHTILLVDDFDDAREMYAEYLTYSGFEVTEAADGVEALRLAVDQLPDIILMDLALPLMDGWEVTRRLKADSRTAHIPVVALTGHALSWLLDAAKRAGCEAWITKPCLPDDLLREVRRVLAETQSSPPDRSRS